MLLFSHFWIEPTLNYLPHWPEFFNDLFLCAVNFRFILNLNSCNMSLKIRVIIFILRNCMVIRYTINSLQFFKILYSCFKVIWVITIKQWSIFNYIACFVIDQLNYPHSLQFSPLVVVLPPWFDQLWTKQLLDNWLGDGCSLVLFFAGYRWAFSNCKSDFHARPPQDHLRIYFARLS